MEPIAAVINNTLMHWRCIVETKPNVTLSLGLNLYSEEQLRAAYLEGFEDARRKALANFTPRDSIFTGPYQSWVVHYGESVAANIRSIQPNTINVNDLPQAQTTSSVKFMPVAGKTYHVLLPGAEVCSTYGVLEVTNRTVVLVAGWYFRTPRDAHSAMLAEQRQERYPLDSVEFVEETEPGTGRVNQL